MNRILPFTLVALLLAACNMNQPKPGDGREWVGVTCSGFAGWTQCQEKAKRLCPSGYDIANQEENLVTQNRSMMVACQK
jgi:hypothetical protein